MGCVSFKLTSNVKTEVNIDVEHLNIYCWSFFNTFEQHTAPDHWSVSLSDYQFGE